MLKVGETASEDSVEAACVGFWDWGMSGAGSGGSGSGSCSGQSGLVVASMRSSGSSHGAMASGSVAMMEVSFCAAPSLARRSDSAARMIVSSASASDFALA